MGTLKPAPNGYLIKLVRDKTPDVLNPDKKPGELWYEPVHPPHRRRLLKLKLSEEVGEYLVDGGTQELTDIIAVVQALCVLEGKTLADFAAQVQLDPRGGFFKGIGMYGKHPQFDNYP